MALLTEQPTHATDWPTPPIEHSEAPERPSTVALIPAYNEQRFIGSMVLATRQYVDLVVVVDDGSQDGTAEIARRAGAVVVRHQQNAGKAAAINTGFSYLRAVGPRAVVMLDGDGQHRADDIPAVLAPVLRGEADVVVGSRFLGISSDIPAYRQMGQRGLTIITNMASGVSVSDSQSGFRALSAQALEALYFTQGGFSIESEMQFRTREEALRVAEVPIGVIYREPAKRSPIGHGLQVLGGILHLVGQTRPLLYFGLVGALVGVLGVALGLYVVQIYTGTLRLAVGYALVSVLLCVVGTLLFFAGVMLHSTRCMLHDLRQTIVARMRDATPLMIEG